MIVVSITAVLALIFALCLLGAPANAIYIYDVSYDVVCIGNTQRIQKDPRRRSHDTRSSSLVLHVYGSRESFGRASKQRMTRRANISRKDDEHRAHFISMCRTSTPPPPLPRSILFGGRAIAVIAPNGLAEWGHGYRVPLEPPPDSTDAIACCICLYPVMIEF